MGDPPRRAVEAEASLALGVAWWVIAAGGTGFLLTGPGPSGAMTAFALMCLGWFSFGVIAGVMAVGSLLRGELSRPGGYLAWLGLLACLSGPVHVAALFYLL